MTCNVRRQSPEDGDNQFIHRVDYLCETLNRIHPDVIGFQELTPAMRLAMIHRMPDYAFLGGGRDRFRLEESPAIAIDQSRLMPERLSTDILSFTPTLPGSTFGGDQSVCPRAFCSAELMPLDGGKPFRVMNVHTDHVGARARFCAVVQMLQSLSAQDAIRPMETVFTGDFNATPDSPEIQLIHRYRDGALIDATAELNGTFHQFERLADPHKIDYIWLSKGWHAQRVEAFHDTRNGLFLSDHDPVLVTAEEV